MAKSARLEHVLDWYAMEYPNWAILELEQAPQALHWGRLARALSKGASRIHVVLPGLLSICVLFL